LDRGTARRNVVIYTQNKTRKTPSSIVKNAGLLVRYLAIDVLLLRARVLREYVLPARCLAIAIYVTIFFLPLISMDPLPLVDRVCGLVVTVPGYRSRRPGFDIQRYQIF
jgi:hypothetical protein